MSDEESGSDNASKEVTVGSQVAEAASKAEAVLSSVITRVKSGELNTSKGMSFLDLKNQLFLSYLSNLSYLMLKKVSGQDVCGDSAIERLVSARVHMDKIKPIEKKLKYQIDKLLRVAISGQANASDPLRFKPNPENMLTKLHMYEDEEGENSDSGADTKKKSGIYVPPKLAAVHYGGDKEEKAKRQEEMMRKKALSSSIMQDLRREHGDEPEEISHAVINQTRKKKEKEQKRYEEEYMLRLPRKKIDNIQRKEVSTIGTLGDDLMSFMGMSAGSSKEQTKKGKRKKSSLKRKGKLGKPAKRRRETQRKAGRKGFSSLTNIDEATQTKNLKYI